MSKIKIYELAKQIDKQSKDIITFLKDKGFEVKSHMSNIEDTQVDMIKNHFGKSGAVQVKATETKPIKSSGEVKTNHRPVQSNSTNGNRPAQQSNNTNTAYQNTSNRPVQDGNNVRTNSNNTNRPAQNSGNRSTQTGTNRPAQNSGNRPYQNSGSRPTQNSGNRPMQNNGSRPTQNNGNRPTQNSTNRPYQNSNNSGSSNNNNRSNQSNYNKPNQGYNNNRGEHNSNNRNTQGTNDNRRSNGNNRNTQGNRYNQGNFRNNESNSNVSKKDPNRKGAFIMPKPQPQVVEKEDDGIKTIIIPETLTIKELGDKMKVPAAAIVKKLFLAGKMVSINQEITFEEAEEIAIEYDCIVEQEEKINIIEELLKEEEEDTSTFKKRPPVVCVMGHVDHGKTSLLDAIRQTHVTNNEAGGITQHIGAYTVNVGGEKITFLDTPGHEAFTSMRMRGAQSTDIAILVVAADDGVMPQTIEAISHAKAAGIEIIVAVNKIDKPSANIDRVKQELTEYELIAEDWGGSTIFVPVSAHTKEGINELLEMINLTAEVLELKANPDRNARGVVIEAQLDKGRGPVATILVQKGTLHVGDSIAIGSAYGKVRAMMDDKGRRVKEADPSTPVEILGLNEVPNAGEIFMATDNEKEARNIAEAYIKQSREKLLEDTKSKLSLDGLFSQIQAGNIKELNIIIKADVQGSVEAMKQSLLKLSNDEVAIRILHGGVGTINESDVNLAVTSNAIIIGFNVRPDNAAKDTADREKVDLRLYRVIYNAIEDIENAMKGLLDPTYEEKVLGHAEVRQVFKASGLGSIAGSYVLDGKIVRNSSARIMRDGSVIYDGPLASLKRFKDDVKEVASGYECGLVFEKFNDIKEGDTVEIYIMQEVPR
ncbi:translation initiation factor IF-2 [Mobilisporobacter senegalensis]|uniref:Translation initiation factor IF-2 n=1 Tax=Mobilisporobacter senegalensis TaxID=1329262 RepID=A0A3N1XW27_9FIRM|nr:translation initiation factor IF-2 [Mobilisporobacter senegalensis]ROR30820.1 translation initiation factor IF-2 [Mobilisporobacter senegalensis]